MIDSKNEKLHETNHSEKLHETILSKKEFHNISIESKNVVKSDEILEQKKLVIGIAGKIIIIITIFLVTIIVAYILSALFKQEVPILQNMAEESFKSLLALLIAVTGYIFGKNSD